MATQEPSGSLTLETVWRHLSVAMYKTNATKASQANTAARGVLRIMGRGK